MAMSSANSSFLGPFCDQIERLLIHSPYSIVLHVHLVVLSAVLIAIAVLFRQYAVHRRIAVHPNLLFLFGNLVALYLFNTVAYFAFVLRFRILMSVYTDGCQLLTPFWLSVVFVGPSQVYVVAFPCLHLLVMSERARATFLADKYETEGKRLVTLCCALTWLISVGYLAYQVVAALGDPSVSGHPQGYIVLTAQSSAQPIMCVTLAMLLLTVFTATCDWRIYAINKRIRAMRIEASDYSLSRNYQLNENALVMRLILPLDLSYALVYPLYTALVFALRLGRSTLSTGDYLTCYNALNTLLFLHSLGTLVVYTRFIVRRSSRMSIRVQPAPEQVHMYFKQLQAQWA